MKKYLMIWRLNPALIPIDRKERGTGFKGLMEFVKQDIERGLVKDWGCFVGERTGYIIVEGTEVDVIKMVQQYSPFVEFKTHPIASLKHVDEVIRSLLE